MLCVCVCVCESACLLACMCVVCVCACMHMCMRARTCVCVKDNSYNHRATTLLYNHNNSLYKISTCVTETKTGSKRPSENSVHETAFDEHRD